MRVSNFRPKHNLQKRYELEEQVVVQAIMKLGGVLKLPVMKFRKHLDEPMGESQIKKTLQRLHKQGQIEQLGERCDCRGHIYKLVRA